MDTVSQIQNETLHLIHEFTLEKEALFASVLTVVQKYEQKVHQYQEELFTLILKLDAVELPNQEARLKRKALIEEIQRAMNDAKAEHIELPLIKKTPLRSPPHAQLGVGRSHIRYLASPKPNNKLMIVRC